MCVKSKELIAFLVLEGKLPINIFNKLERAYGDAAIGYRLSKSGYLGLKVKEKIQV